MSSSSHSKDFFDLVKSIGESRSKQEEDKIVEHEVRVLKVKMADKKGVSSKKMKEFLIRMIYVEMLGHDASFGHIHGINMVKNKSLVEKRVGYLAVSLTLHKDHSFMLLLVNSLQQDLQSENFLEVSMALTVVCKLVNAETMNILMPLVVKALEHKQANIRKKAVMVLQRFYQLQPDAVMSLNDKVRKVLCDKDPSVMGAALCLFEDMCQAEPSLFKDLVPSFVSILKQVVEHRLPRDYDYHRMPAPWIQLAILRTLSYLGENDRNVSEGMYEVLHEVMKRADIGINVGYAIVYECVRTVIAIYPDASLIEDAALSISRFITSDNHNLKYLGINSLASIVQIDPKYAAEHQLLVIDCLEDPDETLRRKTLDLLYSMTNTQNVTFIVEKLIDYLRNTTDVYLRTELVSRINQLAEKFSPNTWWYIETLNTVIDLGGSLVKTEVAHNLMRLISETEEMVDDGNGGEIDVRVYAVETYLELLNQTDVALPDILIQIISWVLGEYAQMSSSLSTEAIISKLASCMDRVVTDQSTKSWVLSGLMKLLAHQPNCIPQVQYLIDRYQRSMSVDLQQRSHEFMELVKTPALMKVVLPQYAHSEEIDVDESLSHLDSYVQTALSNGAKPYSAPQTTSSTFESHATTKSLTAGLKFDAYEAPKTQFSTPSGNEDTWNIRSASANNTAAQPAVNDSGLNLTGTKNMWGPKGFNASPQEEKKPPMQETYTPAPSANTFSSTPDYTEPERPRPVKQEVPRELSEREKAAAALFGGGGGSMAPKRPGVRPGARSSMNRPTSNAAPVQSQPAPQQQPAPVVDLLGLGTVGQGASAPVQATPAAAPSTDLVDLLGDAFASPAPVTAAAPAASGGVDLLGGFGGFEIGGGSQTAPANSGNLGGGLADLFGVGSPATASQVPCGSAGMSDSMKAKLSSLPPKASDEQVLLNSAALHVSFYKVYLPDRLIVATFITNKSSSTVSNAVLEIASGGFVLTFDGEPAPSVQNAGSGSRLVLAQIAAGQTATQIISLQCSQPLASAVSSLQCGITGNGLTPSQFTVPLELKDILRPAQITTQQYGAAWGSLAAEVKFSVHTPVGDSNSFMLKAKEAGLFPVQTIGLENITAGMLAGSKHLCLLHGKVKPGQGIDVLIHSGQQAYSQQLAQHFQKILS
mmetsp:Transcript_37052/g.72769  ORF Transcript_37052/g.72769 Transcript_37052/m.72769 type:complete len:1154 (+) Transcript_37052:39-3500(+)|eukprot:CAMPEP_0175161498 /NCGR_PEP_ID=MMETSP0087-20121206/24638_1 /TAXON_ID=136419 /ORGANISM="Unknown Unknown, Strain D1" /LENGTH=1153 /DNA_ID=CAMNT_0016449919 /DNA_START=40 /DNA_END=3501 /DNA_ORIENTATION=-